MICVSLVEEDLTQALDLLPRAEEVADLVEIRLDALKAPAVKPFLARAKKPLLFTYRAKNEGGFRESPLEERLFFLKEAASHGAFAVDLELAAGAEVIAELKTSCQETKLVLSHHDFSGTPGEEELRELVKELKDAGADVGKLVTTAHTYEEALAPLNLIIFAKRELSFPLISFAMGARGLYSRLVALLLGAPWSYASLPGRAQAAPGQIPAPLMRELLSHLTA